ncbi:g6829 [Coccomyxa viridis]|uniref:G6829 protein n=1 Tax=Coccomyxa viridis TaxID=1274662 RepID=A0ABP1G2X4_9CHLO
MAAASPTPRLAVLAAVAFLSLAAHGRALNIVARPSKAWKHESIKVTTSLIASTVCMIAGILSRKDELYLKNPAVIASIRGWSLLAEGYRLNVALSLHAIQMVCFVFQEVDMCLEAKWDAATSLRVAASHALILLALGKALPILAAVCLEGQARLQFLRLR